MYKKINFRDRIDKKPDSYFVDDKEVTITKNDAEVAQFGTNLNATNLNHMEEGILQNSKDIEELKKGNLEVEQIKYEELKKIIDEKQLKVGNKYLLIDYATKYEQLTSKIIKTGEIEPLLLTASSSNTLEPVAYSPKYPQDIIFYDFNNNKCEDEKTPRNGFITKRIDTVNYNSAPGDFRNLLWIRYLPDEKQYYLKDKLTDYEVWIEGKAKLNVLYKSENKILISKKEEVPKNATDSNVFEIIFDDITNESCALFIKDKNKIYKDIKIKIGKKVERKTFGKECTKNDLGNYIGLYNTVFGKGCVSNTFKNSCYDNSFGDNCSKNFFKNSCHDNSFGNFCRGNSFGNDCCNNSFGEGCCENSFGNNCNGNNLKKFCYRNAFGNYCYYITFKNNCNDNSFGNGCNGNSFGNGCNSNSFGNDCDSNSFENDCGNNSFGNNCDNNSFGHECHDNSFGNDCDNNSFGNDCYNNSFFNNNDFNTFGNDTTGNFIQNLKNKNLSAKTWQYTTFFYPEGEDRYCYYNYLRGNMDYSQLP